MTTFDIILDVALVVALVFIVWGWIRNMEYKQCDRCGHEFAPFDDVIVKNGNAYCEQCWKEKKKGGDE